tara:strand:- start:577 stop:990 length:414 start_codon:yes stop_codon:yes gene_type:complete
LKSGSDTNATVRLLQKHCSQFAYALCSRLQYLAGKFKAVFSSLPRWYDSLRGSKQQPDGHPSQRMAVSLSYPDLQCSVCDSVFDIEAEGGIAGDFGVCPVAFCPWCFSSMVDMVQQGCYRCVEQEALELEENPPSIN